jgi:hypothetical protein
MSARWVKAWGKFPSASPVGPVSSEYRPRWFAYPSICSKTSLASRRRCTSVRPAARTRASTSQNVQMLNVPSSPLMPSELRLTS